MQRHQFPPFYCPRNVIMCKRKSIDTSVDDRSTAKYTLLLFVSKDGAPNPSDNRLLLMHCSNFPLTFAPDYLLAIIKHIERRIETVFVL